ncbi:probable cysteine--tRNA ligase, mitochondrial isoform X1 [Hippocampus comes]|uniref:Probable cysteine--tRNA ligase, mitochondrial n=1 Tax=Hippocampus comes TaxID=109280 RepID=A0A3Q3DL51_HIPCM|nr:PREDICTED: probable cysteine--tRNA ligase, mitochondrial isoform X1 [Hippocampus comes]XP_019723705.1 PREDICTED: probable cysteine--tRNA ligase, mitochondrial isoform X1 [Hippocampus comes]
MWRNTVKSFLRRTKGLRVRAKNRGSCSRSDKKWVTPTGFDTGLKTFNSLTKQKEPLILAREGIATWYSCGPTVYDHAHLGHACSYVRFDVLQRILSRLFGITVIHAMVITDIDDKIIQRGWQDNVSPIIIARMYEEEFKKDMISLKVIPPAVYLRVTENVPQIVAFIQRIIENGNAYATKEGDVYFDIQSIGDRYGKFGIAGDSQEGAGSVSKKDVRDFALWKRSKPQEPHWESPWGPGRPGWHIECSTVASSVFGSQLDIHSGGVDLAFPHHENEVAQSEAYHRCEQWANYFLHSGHLHLKGSAEKMSKSLKNYITIKDFLRSHTANEFRMFCLLTKYRSAIDYSDSSMSEARGSLASICTYYNDAQAYVKGQLQCLPVQDVLLWERLAQTKANVMAALADDFDTPRAMNAIMDLVYQGNCQLQPVSTATGASRSPAVFGAMAAYIRDILDVFGIDSLHDKDAESMNQSGSLPAVVEQLTQFRSEVRAFALTRQSTTPGKLQEALYPERIPLLQASDQLRKNLAPLGVLIKDRGATSTWELTKRASEITDGMKPSIRKTGHE